MNHKNKRFQVTNEDIEKTEIRCLSFSSLVKKYDIKKVKKLMMVLLTISLETINYKEVDINQIIFEKKHFDGLFNEGKKLDEIKDVLTTNGYNINDLDDENIIAIKK